jgi:DNA polymerase-3 subunit alpha
MHTHSIGSLRDGIMKVSDHVKFAKDHNKKYVPITDHGSISEWIELHNQAKKEKLTPIYGIEGYISPDRKEYLETKVGKPHHIVLLALNEIGFKNIVKIHNDAWQHFYKRPVMSYETLYDHNEGVIVSSACMNGTLPRFLAEKDFANADKYIEKMLAVFGDRFFIELHIIDMKEQEEMNRMLIQIAKKHNVPTLINNDSHYMKQGDNKAHQISLLLQSDQTVKDLEQGKGWKFSAQDLWMKDENELFNDWKSRYKNDPIFTEDVFVESTWNVDKITNRVEDIYLEHPPRLPKYEKGKEKFREMVIEGFGQKVNEGLIPAEKIDEYMDRIKYELKTIDDLDLVDYFLLIKDIHEFCDKNDIAVGPGRGSVSASLVTFLIGITKLDPIKYNFIFERFLNPARKTQLKIFSAGVEVFKDKKVRPNVYEGTYPNMSSVQSDLEDG